MNKRTLPKRISVDEVNQFKNFAYTGLSFDEMTRNGVISDDYFQLLPFPANALVDGAIRPEFLPEIMQNLNKGLNYALSLKDQNKKDFRSRHFSLVDEIRIVYIECVHAIEVHNITDSDLTAIDCTLKIIENKMTKIGLNPEAIKDDLDNNKRTINREFYSTQLDNGDRVLLSKGVLMMAALKDEELDFGFLSECIRENEFVRGYLVKEIRDAFECYVMNPMFSDRMAMDFSTLESNAEILHRFAGTRNLKPLTNQQNVKVFDNLEFSEESEIRNNEYQRALRAK